MVGSFADLGKLGGTTILDLTLGVDRDGDGIPDSWEEALLNALSRDFPARTIKLMS